ncbi:MAG: hypothetical protein QOH10_1446 [Actinomycetota bacterium]|jgi:uncharacterized protein YjbJ (UPF0337 family)|nr:hypothetical protein [Actinomycetota bacterium]
MQLGQVDMNKLRGLGDKAMGLAKEVVGTIANNDRLVEEGDAQQARAAEELRAIRKEIEAQRSDAKADVLEQKQKIAQRAKQGA